MASQAKRSKLLNWIDRNGAPEEIRTPNLLIRSQSSNLREDGGDGPGGLVLDDAVDEPPQHEERRGLGAFSEIGVAPTKSRPLTLASQCVSPVVSPSRAQAEQQ